ncbi:type II toxin-antitoxin system RelE/ParE family toxin [soil metagenome]|jgi:proteic killer suppression protein
MVMAIRGFADKTTRRLFEGGAPRGFPQNAKVRALDKLSQLNAAERIEDMAVPPGNQMKALGGDRRGQYAVRVNQQLRLCFAWEDGDAYDVEIVDYH